MHKARYDCGAGLVLSILCAVSGDRFAPMQAGISAHTGRLGWLAQARCAFVLEQRGNDESFPNAQVESGIARPLPFADRSRHTLASHRRVLPIEVLTS